MPKRRQPLTAEDGEVRELTREDFRGMKPIAEVDPGMVEAMEDWRERQGADDAPDLSTPEYQAKLATTPVRRGRPKSDAPKVRVGFRLSADLVEQIRASGPGYNARVEKVLREGFFDPKSRAGATPTSS